MDQSAADKMHLVQNVVTAIRTVRSEAVIPPGTLMNCYIRNMDNKAREIVEDQDVKAFITSSGPAGRAGYRSPNETR